MHIFKKHICQYLICYYKGYLYIPENHQNILAIHFNIKSFFSNINRFKGSMKVKSMYYI